MSSTSQFTRDQGGGEARGRGAQASGYNRPVVGYIQNSSNRNYGTAINTRLSPSVIRSLESPSLYNSQVKTKMSSVRELARFKNAKSLKSHAPQGFSGCLDMDNDEMNKKKI